ncbi:hypothetical protein F5880DRAFT_1271116 [Lentinula raphanica]|nr:hypothetical protein F5880DRAFT_1271116 [Lentinula raphanica]
MVTVMQAIVGHCTLWSRNKRPVTILDTIDSTSTTQPPLSSLPSTFAKVANAIPLSQPRHHLLLFRNAFMMALNHAPIASSSSWKLSDTESNYSYNNSTDLRRLAMAGAYAHRKPYPGNSSTPSYSPMPPSGPSHIASPPKSFVSDSQTLPSYGSYLQQSNFLSDAVADRMKQANPIPRATPQQTQYLQPSNFDYLGGDSSSFGYIGASGYGSTNERQNVHRTPAGAELNDPVHQNMQPFEPPAASPRSYNIQPTSRPNSYGTSPTLSSTSSKSSTAGSSSTPIVFGWMPDANGNIDFATSHAQSVRDVTPKALTLDHKQLLEQHRARTTSGGSTNASRSIPIAASNQAPLPIPVGSAPPNQTNPPLSSHLLPTSSPANSPSGAASHHKNLSSSSAQKYKAFPQSPQVRKDSLPSKPQEGPNRVSVQRPILPRRNAELTVNRTQIQNPLQNIAHGQKMQQVPSAVGRPSWTETSNAKSGPSVSRNEIPLTASDVLACPAPLPPPNRAPAKRPTLPRGGAEQNLQRATTSTQMQQVPSWPSSHGTNNAHSEPTASQSEAPPPASSIALVSSVPVPPGRSQFSFFTPPQNLRQNQQAPWQGVQAYGQSLSSPQAIPAVAGSLQRSQTQRQRQQPTRSLSDTFHVAKIAGQKRKASQMPEDHAYAVNSRGSSTKPGGSASPIYISSRSASPAGELSDANVPASNDYPQLRSQSLGQPATQPALVPPSTNPGHAPSRSPSRSSSPHTSLGIGTPRTASITTPSSSRPSSTVPTVPCPPPPPPSSCPSSAVPSTPPLPSDVVPAIDTHTIAPYMLHETSSQPAQKKLRLETDFPAPTVQQMVLAAQKLRDETRKAKDAKKREDSTTSSEDSLAKPIWIPGLTESVLEFEVARHPPPPVTPSLTGSRTSSSRLMCPCGQAYSRCPKHWNPVQTAGASSSTLSSTSLSPVWKPIWVGGNEFFSSN